MHHSSNIIFLFIRKPSWRFFYYSLFSTTQRLIDTVWHRKNSPTNDPFHVIKYSAQSHQSHVKTIWKLSTASWQVKGASNNAALRPAPPAKNSCFRIVITSGAVTSIRNKCVIYPNNWLSLLKAAENAKSDYKSVTTSVILGPVELLDRQHVLQWTG